MVIKSALAIKIVPDGQHFRYEAAAVSGMFRNTNSNLPIKTRLMRYIGTCGGNNATIIRALVPEIAKDVRANLGRVDDIRLCAVAPEDMPAYKYKTYTTTVTVSIAKDADDLPQHSRHIYNIAATALNEHI